MLEASPELAMLRTAGQELLPRWISDAGGKERMKEYLADTVKEDWFSGPAEYQATLGKYTAQFGRIIDYFRAGGNVFAGGARKFEVRLGKTLISDRADMSYTGADSAVHFVKFEMYHANPYSQRARKAENLPKYSLELLLMAMGIGDADAVYEIWYLRSKNDKKGTYPGFEDREGASMACLRFADCEEDGGTAACFSEACRLNMKEFTPDTCESCRLKPVCIGYRDTPECADGAAADAKDRDSVPSLTPAQERVAGHKDGTLAVIAVPGAGKTFVLVERMKRLIGSGVRPGNILFLSHTRKAVEEIQERVAKALGIGRDDAGMPEVLTLNGFGYNILRDNEKFLGALKLAGDAERKELEEYLMNSADVPKFEGWSYTNILAKNGLLDKVDRWVSCLLQNGEEEVARRYRVEGVNMAILRDFTDALNRLMEKNGYIRYDQQIEMVVQLFREHPDIALGYSKIYRYVMVDEYQDVNGAQDEMVRLLCVHGNLVVVGDDDQSIYGWRGGSNQYLIRFANDHDRVIMNENFRTNVPLAHLANVTIAANRERIAKNIRAGRNAAAKPLLAEQSSAADLVSYVAKMAGKYGHENVAVIARDNRTLIEFAEALDAAGIRHASPKDYLTGSKVFGVIRDVLRVHRLGADEASESFARLYNSSVGICEDYADYGESYARMLVRTGRLLPVDDTVKNAMAYRKLPAGSPCRAFGESLFASYRVLNYAEGIDEAITGVFDCWFSGTENELVVLRALLEMFEECRVQTSGQALTMMDRLVRYSDMTRVDYNYGKGFVKMYTAHDSKGKEFDSVLLLNIDQFLWGGTEEDLRVLYVAMTRARHTLVMSTLGNSREPEILEEIRNACSVVKK